MDSPSKSRPKSAPVITSAYVENKREEAWLGVKLDCMYYQHRADMIRWRQAKDHIVQRRRNLLIQKGISPLSTLERVMDQIQSHKRDKHTPNTTNTHRPASAVQRGGMHTYPNWPPLSSSLLHDVPHFTNNVTPPAFVIKTDRTHLAVVGTKTQPGESVSQSPESSERNEKKKPRAMSTEPRKPNNSIESMTYKELGVIARLDNISMREEERQKQQKLLERQQLKKTQEMALKHKIDTFLKKIE